MSKKKYTIYTDDDSINEQLNVALDKLSDRTCTLMHKNLLSSSSQNQLNAFHEVKIAEAAHDRGYEVEYSVLIDNKRPDLYDSSNRLVIEALSLNQAEGQACPMKRIERVLNRKASKYKGLVRKRKLAYIIAIYCNDAASADDCEAAIMNCDFFRRKFVSGVWYINSEQEKYFPNPFAAVPFNLVC